MTPTPAFVSYEFAGRKELCLSAGDISPRHVMLVPPLFDEMNRMRKLLADVMRELDSLGVGSFLPDLPGTNESLAEPEHITLVDWQKALQVCAQQHKISHIASFRGGALALPEIPSAHYWIFSPVKGATLLRMMMRTKVAADREAGLTTTIGDLSTRAASGPLELAGNMIGPDLFTQLEVAQIPEWEKQRTVRLDSDQKPADARIPGSPLWLRAEPDDDPAMSVAIARDIAVWITA